MTADYATLRAEARENAEDNAVAAWQAHEADWDREDDGQHYNYPDNGSMEPS